MVFKEFGRSGRLVSEFHDAVSYSGTGQPIQLQVRVQLRKSNADYGDPSMIGLVTVNP